MTQALTRLGLIRTFTSRLSEFLLVHSQNPLAMGKSKKSLEDLKNDLKTLKDKDMDKIIGGKKGKKDDKKGGSGCGGIVPQ